MRRLFGRTPPEVPERRKPQIEHSEETVQKQQVESAKTLDYVKSVLDEKDRLLADAINQTGSALRRARPDRRAGDTK